MDVTQRNPVLKTLTALKKHSQNRDLLKGELVHATAIQNGLFYENIYVANSVLNMYVKCGCMDKACSVFNQMSTCDVVSWNTLIFGYVENGDNEVALDMLGSMRTPPNALTFVACFKACANLASKEQGKAVDGKIVKVRSFQKGKTLHDKCSFVSDLRVANTLIGMYMKCGFDDEARKVFEKMESHTVVSWNALALGYAENGQGTLALKVVSCMDCKPDAFTFIAALNACISMAVQAHDFLRLEALKTVLIIHSNTRNCKFISDVFIQSTLMEAYVKCGCLVDARRAFEYIDHQDVVCWTILILGYADNGEGETALDLFCHMASQGCAADALAFIAAMKASIALAPKDKVLALEKGMGIHFGAWMSNYSRDPRVQCTLVDMYAKCGSLKDAHKVFERITFPDQVSWNALILGYAENGEAEIALDLFRQMQAAGHAPDPLAFVSALKACSVLAAKNQQTKALEMGTRIHLQAVSCSCDSDILLANTLIDMYGKCGNMDSARKVFDQMRNRDAVSWNALLFGYAANGESHAVLELFPQMDVAPDSLTFVAAVKACTKSGSLQAGKALHVEIITRGLDKDEALMSSLVDFYSKCGCLNEAQSIFDSLHSKNLATWNALMGGYGRQGDAGRVFEMFDLMRDDQSVQANEITFLCLLTSCSHAGLLGKGKEYFELLLLASSHGLRPSIEHYHCMVDMLARANELEAAVEMAKCMPFERDQVTLRTLLGGACG